MVESYTVTSSRADGKKFTVTIDRYSPDRIGELKERIRKANDAMVKYYQDTLGQREIGKDVGPRWDFYEEARVKIQAYCDQLKLMEFAECLYIDEETGKKSRKCLTMPGCVGCVSDFEYWHQELEELPPVSRDLAPTLSQPVASAIAIQSELSAKEIKDGQAKML